LEEVAEVCHIEYVAQKVRKEAEKQRLIEEKEKRKWMGYLQQ